MPQFRLDEKITAALHLEKEGDLLAAEKTYLQVIAKVPTAYKAYDRLMVIYRRQKKYREEITIIAKAIKAFESAYLERQKQWIAANKVAARMSRSLAISLGVIDKRGLPTTYDPMLVRWNKRKDLLSKRVAKAKVKKP